ncbi:MAG TPA: hypothetical protein VFM18_17730 [Methanosarcina sp.]|nr:hypothetical protein [Methanosarcina sp.]
MWWLLYNKDTLTIHNRFYLEKDAQKKLRKIERNQPMKDWGIDYLDPGVTEKQWRMWKQLQR